MRFTITAAENSLPLVAAIPAYDGIVRLEGVNGAGKTLSTQLLALCAGARPLEGEAWLSFCSGLPHVKVEAADLSGGETIEWTIAGATLHEAAKDDPISWFESIRVNGAEVSEFERIRELFGVEILKGDVGLVETLARQIEEESARAEELRSGPIGTQVQRLGELVEQVRDVIGRLRTEDIVARHRDLQAAESALEESGIAHEALRKRVKHVEAVRACSVDLDSSRLSYDELQSELGELRSAIAARENERAEIKAKLDKLEKGIPDADRLADDLRTGETSRKRAITAMTKATAGLRDLHELAAVDDETDLDELAAELEAERDRTRARRLALDATPAVLELIETLTPPLRGASADGLGQQELFRLPDDQRPVDIDSALAGLMTRKAKLPEADTDDEVSLLDARLQQLATRIDALAAIPAAQAKLDSASERLNKAEKKLANLAKQLGSDSAAAVETLRTQQGDVERALISLGGQVRTANQRLERLPTETERADRRTWVDAEIDKLGIAEEQLETAVEELRADLVKLSADHQLQVIRVADLRESHGRDISQLREFANSLGDPEFAWLELSVPKPEDASVESLLRALHQVHAAAELIDARQSAAQQVLDGVPVTLSSIAARLRGPDQPATFARPELEAWAASLAAAWFKQTGVGDELLDADATDISVDIKRRLVRWRVGNSGDEQIRPLEALSSGQQAFTFTKARLALLRQQSPRATNRLLVLDEYGAFVSHDRLRVLERLLFDWRDSHQGDQILLILPAVQDYAGLSETVSGDLRLKYLERAEQLRGPGYFTEALRPA